MFSRSKSKNRLVIRSSPEMHGERTKSGKNKSLSREFDILFSKINNIREWTKNLIRDSIAIVSTESDMDIKSYLNDSEKKHLGKTKLENLGTDMIKASKSSGVKGGKYEKALLKVGECELRLGTYARDFVIDVCSSFIRPLKYFMDVELNKLLEEKEMLTSRKIDYDYHVRQGSNGRADKNTQHKLKMAEMALEFQYIHAKEILEGIEVSECQVGHLSDLVSVQSVYHQKCLAELGKLKDELKRMSSNVSTGKNDQNSVFDNSMKTSVSISKKRADEGIPPEVLPSCIKRPQNHSNAEDNKTPDSRIPVQERFQNANRSKQEKSLIESVHGEEAEGKRCVPEGMKGIALHSDQNERSEFQPKTAHVGKFPQKARSSVLPSVESKRARLEKIPEDPRSRPNIELSQKCDKHRSKVCSTVKTGNKPSVSPSCHHYSGDYSPPGGGRNKDDYTSDDSTTSKETHVIPIPVRSNYRRDVGKMFFTPCKDLE